MNYKSCDARNGSVKCLNLGATRLLFDVKMKSGTYSHKLNFRSENGRKTNCNCSI